MNDQERITDLILTEKKMSANYDTFASECVNVQLRDEFLKLLNQRLVCRRPQAAKPVLRRGSSRSAFPLWGKAVMAYPPTGSVQTECTRLPVMLRTKGRFLCQRTIGFVGLQKHINSGYAFAERQIAHNGKRGKGTRSPHGLKDYPT